MIQQNVFPATLRHDDRPGDAKTADEETGRLTVTDYKRQRLTGGITFSLKQSIPHRPPVELREILLCQNSIAKESEQDKGGIGIDGTFLIFLGFPFAFSFQKVYLE